MASNYNDQVIEKIHKCFRAESQDSADYNKYYPFTNCALVFAYNGTGKTRLSYDFAHYGRQDDDTQKHTLYYNAYTEDLFTWKNDHENNEENVLLINQDTAFIQGLAGIAIEVKLRKYLQMFVDIDFDFDYVDNNPSLPPCGVRFNKKKTYQQELNGEIQTIEEVYENIKISRGEERLFVWCFFRCIMDEVLADNPAYSNIEYIYIDDPMSSLDDNNVIAFAQQLYEVIRNRRDEEVKEYEKGDCRRIKFIISSHHALFFHTMLHGLNGDQKLGKYYLSRNKQKDQLILKTMSSDTPFYYNVAMMSELQKAIYTPGAKLYTYHFTILRGVIEKIKEFFGHHDFSIILKGIEYRGQILDKDEDAEFFARVMNVLTHQGAMFTPVEMNEDNRELAIAIFNHLIKKYDFKLPNLNSSWSEARIKKYEEEKFQTSK